MMNLPWLHSGSQKIWFRNQGYFSHKRRRRCSGQDLWPKGYPTPNCILQLICSPLWHSYLSHASAWLNLFSYAWGIEPGMSPLCHSPTCCYWIQGSGFRDANGSIQETVSLSMVLSEQDRVHLCQSLAGWILVAKPVNLVPFYMFPTGKNLSVIFQLNIIITLTNSGDAFSTGKGRKSWSWSVSQIALVK